MVDGTRAPAIDSQFPQWSDLPIAEVEFDGSDNRTFRLGSRAHGPAPSGDRYAQQVEKEQRWLPTRAALPLPIPTPVAKGEPGAGSRPWSVYRWLDGEPRRTRASTICPASRRSRRVPERAAALDATAVPPPGEHNFFRGGPLATYERRGARGDRQLGDEIPRDAAPRVGRTMRTSWDREPVWLHGDVATGNLLVRDGRLAAVLDFGSSGVGDPACDLVIAWTFLTGAAATASAPSSAWPPAPWARGRGWALWKALITLVGHLENDSPDAALPRRDIRSRSSPTTPRTIPRAEWTRRAEAGSCRPWPSTW